MATNFIQTLAQASRQPAEVPPITSQNSTDMIRAALEGKADLSETIRRIMASGIGVQAISNIFTSLGIQQSSAVGAYIKAVGVMGAGQGIRDYAGTLDHRAGKEFLARAGHSGTSRPTSIPREAFDHAIADAYGSLSHEQQRQVISHMLFEPGHDLFWDQMAAHGHMKVETAEAAKAISNEMPQRISRQHQATAATIANGPYTPEEKERLSRYTQTSNGQKMGELLARRKAAEDMERQAQLNSDKKAEEMFRKQKEAQDHLLEQRIKDMEAQGKAVEANLYKSLLDQARSPETQAKAQRENEERHRELLGLAAKRREELTDADKNREAALQRQEQIHALGQMNEPAQIAQALDGKVGSELKEDVVKSAARNDGSATGLSTLAKLIENNQVKTSDLDKGSDSIKVVESNKESPVAAKGSGGLDDDGPRVMSVVHTPQLNIAALDKRRSQQEEGNPASTKTASMQA